MSTIRGTTETTAFTAPRLPSPDADAASTGPIAFDTAKPSLIVAALAMSAMMLSGSSLPEQQTSIFWRRRDALAAENQTTLFETTPDIRQAVRKVFDAGAREFFEDGVESSFSRDLANLVAKHGAVAFNAIFDYVSTGYRNPDVVSEALRRLADFGMPSTLPARWAILRKSLRDASPKVRDGAILGFAALDDARASTLLREAREDEQLGELRHLIDQVLEQLGAHGTAAQDGSTK